MKATKKNIALCLMVSSLLMLVVLQFLWLKNSYENAHQSLSRQSFSIFNTTVLSLRDSVFARNITIIRRDSLSQGTPETIPQSSSASDTVKNLNIQVETINPMDSTDDFLSLWRLLCR